MSWGLFERIAEVNNLKCSSSSCDDRFFIEPSTKLPPTVETSEHLISEIHERQKRSNNVLFFNMSEQGDNDDVLTIFSSLSNIPVTVNKQGRIRKPNTNNRRAFKVELSNGMQTFHLLSNRSKLKSSQIFILADLTKQTSCSWRLCGTRIITLRRRNEEETNTHIRYSHGVPKIISKNLTR